MKSGQRTAIARRCLAAVAHACHAIGAGCGWLRRLANAHPEAQSRPLFAGAAGLLNLSQVRERPRLARGAHTTRSTATHADGAKAEFSKTWKVGTGSLSIFRKR